MKKNREIESDEEFNPPICLITESYCDIFKNMHEGTSIYEVMRDNTGKINNLKVMYFNHASILNEVTSLKKAVGKTLEELFNKEIEVPYLEIVDRVISTGKGMTFETFFEPNGKYFLISAFSPNPDLYITLSLDITENKRYEMALKESEKDFRALVENSPNGVTRFDRNLRHIFINLAGAQMTGLSPEDYIGKTHHELGLPKELANQVTNLLTKVFETGNPETFEFEIPAPEGPKYYISNNIPEFDENGNVKSILAIAHDITNIKKAEEELRSSEQKFRKTIKESYDGIMLIDEKRRIIEWNKAMEEITGLKREEMLGSFLWDFMYKVLIDEKKTPEVYNEIKSALIKNLNENMAFQPNRRIEREIQCTNGERKFIESTVYPIKTEKGTMYGSITRDITEKKILEQKLKEREEKYRAIFENTGNPTIIIEKDMTISLVNEEFENVTGYSKEEIKGTKWTEIVLKDDLEYMKQYHNLRRIDPSKAPKNYEAHILNKNGDIRTINLTVGIIKEEDESVASFIDITEIKKDEEELENYRYHLEELVKKRAEELENAYNALFESEEKFRELFNKATDMISLNEINENCMPGKFIEVNEVASRRLGYLKEELLNMSPVNIVAPENRDEMPKNAARLCKEGDATFEIVHITKDGKRIPVEVTNHLFKLRDKTLALAISRDITERKKAEEALRESEGKFRALYDDNPSMYFTIDPEFTILSVNSFGAELLGYTVQELISQPLSIVFYEKDKEFAAQNLKHTFENHGQVFHWELRKIRKDGSIFWVKETARAVKEPEGNIAIYTVCEDITDRKEAEESLKESEKKFRELFNQAIDMISLTELNEDSTIKGYIEVNEAAVKRLGYSKEELLNMTPLDLYLDNSSIFNMTSELFEKGYSIAENIQVAKDGRQIPVELNTHLFKSRGKNVVLSISRDITERKNAEIERNQFIEELKRSNNELQQFAYISSHDLQEPLRTIASFTQLLERRYKDKLDQDADEFIEYIVDATKRMQNLIKDLLEYSRITTRSGEFKLISVEKVIKSVLNNLRTIITENNAEITYDPLPEVVADENQIIRVFQNLITNSIKFKKPDVPPKIHISSTKEEENNEYVFSVSDNGIGIEPQYFERIFTIFQRLHTRDEYKGTGIGLAVVKRIIERHGGHIWVESEPGKGSIFYFTIPTTLEQIMD